MHQVLAHAILGKSDLTIRKSEDKRKY
jgi:hypothetical protein